MIKIIEIMFSGIPQFFGCLLILALFISLLENIFNNLFKFLTELVKKSNKNNFYISEKNINEKFLKELEKYADRLTKCREN